jgi:peptidoglycan hydrolase-like protein with peptidoglycan-binding domain
MRNRLLVSAAILVAGVAVASAQHTPGGGHDHQAHDQARNHDSGRRTPNSAAGKSATRATGSLQSRSGPPRGKGSGAENRPKPQHAAAKRPGEPPPSARERGARRDAQAGNRDGRPLAHSHPPAAAPGHRSATDHARSEAPRRRPEQAMGRADVRDLKVQPRTADRKIGTHRAAAPPPRGDSASPAGKADVRKAQAALNQQGFNVGDPDGKLGQRTKKALIAFQKQHGFQTTGKVDRTTLQALNPGGGAQDKAKDNTHKDQLYKDSANKDGTRARGQAPSTTAPQNAPAAPSTTGQGTLAPAPSQPAEEERPANPDGLQMPDASSRVPAGAPQEDYKDDQLPPGGDQR